MEVQGVEGSGNGEGVFGEGSDGGHLRILGSAIRDGERRTRLTSYSHTRPTRSSPPLATRYLSDDPAGCGT